MSPLQILPLVHRILAAATVMVGLAGAGVPAPSEELPPQPSDATATPGDPAAVFARGQALLESGDAARAAAVFEAMLAEGVEHPAVRPNLGAAYSQLGRLDEAVEQQRKAVALSHGNPAVRLNLAIALTKAGRIAQAAEEAARVVAEKPEHRSAVLLLADCYLRIGERARVIELLDPLAGSALQDEAVAYLLGMALGAEGDLDRAQRVIDGILRRETPQAHLLMATMSVAAGDCGRALAELDRASVLGPPLPTEGFLRGQCLMEANDWTGAVQAFRDEIELDPTTSRPSSFSAASCTRRAAARRPSATSSGPASSARVTSPFCSARAAPSRLWGATRRLCRSSRRSSRGSRATCELMFSSPVSTSASAAPRTPLGSARSSRG